jgi:integrase
MPHYPKPFFRAPRGLWYVQIHGRQVNLGPDRDEAFRRYHDLMSRGPDEPESSNGDSAVSVLDAFLDWCQKHRAPRTYDWYRDYLQSFARSIPRALSVERLKPIHVQQWVDSQPGWGRGKRGAITAVQRAFNWAAKMGLIETRPVRHVEKPRAGRRDVVITPEEYAWILGQVKDEEFRDLLIVCWETGCRPQEVLAVEARHVDLDGGRWVFPPDEAKGKKAHRVVYLTDRALEITRRLIALHSEGPLFRNTDGRPWHPYALNCRFGRLRFSYGRQQIQQLGLLPPKIKRLNAAQRRDPESGAAHERLVRRRREQIAELARAHGTKWCLYHFRHSFATRLLEAGTDALTVSALLGHADGAMLARVYSHLSKNGAYLRDAVKAAGTLHQACSSPSAANPL